MKIAKALFLSMAVGALAAPVLAQPADKKPDQPGERPAGERRQRDGQPREGGPREGGRGMGQQLSKEKSEAAWAAEATAAAKRQNLSEDQTKAVVKAYAAARESVRTKMEDVRKARESGEDMQAAMDAVRETETKAKEQFGKALTDAKVSGDAATKLNASLGSGVGPADGHHPGVQAGRHEAAVGAERRRGLRGGAAGRDVQDARRGSRGGARGAAEGARDPHHLAQGRAEQRTAEHIRGVVPRHGPDASPRP
jgi:hypothetical protein